MGLQLKRLQDQVIVITGASSGIGLTTARMAAKRGAKLVLAARNGEALHKLCDELNSHGASAMYVAADVSKESDVRAIASAAIAQFGGFDTWVNNAGVSVFGKLNEVSLEDQRRIFDTNFWGVVHGSLVAVEHFKQRGGALINLGSELSDVGITLQGMYAASKHAVKGFTDSLRMELEEEGAPVSVTLVKPAAVDTMFLAHAKNYMEVEAKLPAPIYAPEAVAAAILFAAEQPKRDIFVGSASKLSSATARLFPRLMDRYMKRFASGAAAHRPADEPPRAGRFISAGHRLAGTLGLFRTCLRIQSVYQGFAASENHWTCHCRRWPGLGCFVAKPATRGTQFGHVALMEKQSAAF